MSRRGAHTRTGRRAASRPDDAAGRRETRALTLDDLTGPADPAGAAGTPPSGGEPSGGEPSGGESSGGGRSRGDRRRARRRGRRLRTAAVLLVLLALFGGAVYGAYRVVAPTVREAMAPKDYTGNGTGAVRVSIPAGATGRDVAAVLETAGVVKTRQAFVTEISRDARGGSLQPGTFTLARHMSAAAALERLLDPSARVASQVVVVDGMRESEVFSRVARDVGVSVAALRKAAADPSDLGLPSGVHGVEGFLFPATYSFDPGTSAHTVVATLVGRTVSELEAAGVPRSRWADTVTRASLVQAEARRSGDFPKVARVIVNRLHAGMRLQFDSTLHYAAGVRSSAPVTKSLLETRSPYNTYRHAGLPPGPIGQPGTAAIRAVLDPAPGHWLYFVTVNDDTGKTLFADDYATHRRNVAQRDAWLASHPAKTSSPGSGS